MKNKSILIIDDDSRHRSLLRTALEHAEFEVVEASNGLEGLKIAQEHNFHCIITDLKMPQMDGLELIEELQKIPAVIDMSCPIIIYSNVTQDYAKEEAMKKGAVELLLKDEITPNQVVETITKLSKH